MGNPPGGGTAAHVGAAAITKFYSSAAWIEGKAIEQLEHVATLDSVRHIAAFPDLHPGKYGPVGCAIASERIYPQFVGNDIGCGMSLFALDLPVRRIRVEKAAARLRALDGPWEGDQNAWLEEAGLPVDLFATSLGTIGGGNHFCELQSVGDVNDATLAGKAGLSKDTALLLVHSGSRGFGTTVFDAVQGYAADGLGAASPEACAYIEGHDRAVRWAALNRRLIAHRAAEALRADCVLVTDSPHNLIEFVDNTHVHRKGAAKADMPFVPLAGSRDALSYLIRPTGADANALQSLAHGAGRKYDRRSMMGRAGASRSDREKLVRTSFGGHVVCEDRQLLVEEAPVAYKNPAHVLGDLVSAGLGECVASLRPLVTFKKIAHGTETRVARQRRKGGGKW